MCEREKKRERDREIKRERWINRKIDIRYIK